MSTAGAYCVLAPAFSAVVFSAVALVVFSFTGVGITGSAVGGYFLQWIASFLLLLVFILLRALLQMLVNKFTSDENLIDMRPYYLKANAEEGACCVKETSINTICDTMYLISPGFVVSTVLVCVADAVATAATILTCVFALPKRLYWAPWVLHVGFHGALLLVLLCAQFVLVACCVCARERARPAAQDDKVSEPEVVVISVRGLEEVREV